MASECGHRAFLHLTAAWKCCAGKVSIGLFLSRLHSGMFPQERAGCSKLGRPNQEAEDDGWDDEDDDDWQPTPKVEEKKGSKDKKPAKDRAAASRKTMNPSPKVQIPFVVLFQRPKVYPCDRTGRMLRP